MDLTTKENVLTLIKEHLPFWSALQQDIHDDSQLSELGLDSLHLITMLFTLQREYSVDMSNISERGMPTTVSGLLALIERSPVNDRNGSDG